ncbi:MAG: bifunctional (p)ppGpp synthetase/guanosine-3',5'-bis(diphosphate) 3'-pyrophosphohydrolase [Desulfobacterales bacterium]
MIRITDIIDKIIEHNPDVELDLVDRAYIYSARVHDGQVRLSGEPYLSHPLEVAGILADMRLDPVSIAAALLHDVIEDTHATREDIESMFGKDVALIVDGVTKLSKIAFKSSQERQAENFRKMILAMANDIRVIFIKLADRLHNMRTLQFHRLEDRKRKIAQETMDIYAPLAARLGIYWIKKELEDTAFMYIMPDEYEKIKGLVNKDRQEREVYVETIKDRIKEKMEQAGLNCEVQGRYKQFWSIYSKMQVQNLIFEDVHDLVAFRIILETVPQCYEALGHIHSLWKPIAKKFKDYIGFPKPNMYQSLHTTVSDPNGDRIEIQIRTWEMDKIANSGIAAHWSYKEGREVDESVGKTYSWLRNLVENQETIKDPDEFLESVRIDLFPDEVYVFTPNGEIHSLPRGATPVDFAYLIHTEVGNQCTGAKVNNRMVPLNTALKTGDRVEIITTKNHTPSKDWLHFVKTVKARSRIRQWIKQQEKERSITLGREMLEKVFRKHRLNFNAISKTEDMQKVAEGFGFKTEDELIASVGYGKNTPLQVVKKIISKSEDENEQESLIGKLVGKPQPKKNKGGILVKGMDDILVRFAKCCRPVPGDAITGYITRGHGVTIHRKNCVNALKTSPERQIDVSWNEEVVNSYPVTIRVRSLDRVGLLADIAGSISKNKANILSVNTTFWTKEKVENIFELSVESTGHLETVLASIKKVSMVHDVKRIDR